MLARTRERDGAGAWLCACALVVCCAALVSAAAERETQLAQAPFIMGSRFGRSPPRLLMPRNDKFFFSSRYGKRSSPLEPPAPPLGPAPPRARPADILCEFTGIQPLYRCRPNNNYQENRRLEGASSGEE